MIDLANDNKPSIISHYPWTGYQISDMDAARKTSDMPQPIHSDDMDTGTMKVMAGSKNNYGKPIHSDDMNIGNMKDMAGSKNT